MRKGAIEEGDDFVVEVVAPNGANLDRFIKVRNSASIYHHHAPEPRKPANSLWPLVDRRHRE